MTQNHDGPKIYQSKGMFIAAALLPAIGQAARMAVNGVISGFKKIDPKELIEEMEKDEEADED